MGTRADRTEQTKARIREVAAQMFSAQGFVATGVREIAREAGVDPAIVIRHFKSKEALFIETMRLPASWYETVDGPVEDLGTRVVALLLEQRDRSVRVWAALIRASDRPDVEQQLRESTTHLFADLVQGRITGEDAQLRAHFFAAQLEGLLMALGIREDPLLLATPNEVMVRRYGALLQHTLTGAWD